MRTMAVKLLVITLFGWLVGLWCVVPGRAFPVTPPRETLGGLTPGISTVGDASRLYGVYDVVLPGDFSQYAGGPRATKAYRWTTGLHGKVPGLIVETPIGSPVITTVVVDSYPGIGTACGLMTLVPEQQVPMLYGLPDYAYELNFNGQSVLFRELYYVNRGLLVVLGQVEGRPNWTVVKLILTYPTYLRNAVAVRTRYASAGQTVEDITDSYRVWTHMAVYPHE